MNPRDLAGELLRLLNERDVEQAMWLFRPDAELCFPRYAPRTVFRGRPELGEFVAWLTDVLPLQTLAVGRITATDAAATVEFESAGTSSRGHDFDGSGVLVIDVVDGLISALRVYVDTADLARILDVA